MPFILLSLSLSLEALFVIPKKGMSYLRRMGSNDIQLLIDTNCSIIDAMRYF